MTDADKRIAEIARQHFGIKANRDVCRFAINAALADPIIRREIENAVLEKSGAHIDYLHTQLSIALAMLKIGDAKPAQICLQKAIDAHSAAIRKLKG